MGKDPTQVKFIARVLIEICEIGDKITSLEHQRDGLINMCAQFDVPETMVKAALDKLNDQKEQS